MHECPAPGCTTRVERSRLACVRHWYALPKQLRDDVWAAYRRHGTGTPEHTAAITAAVKWLRANVTDGRTRTA